MKWERVVHMFLSLQAVFIYEILIVIILLAILIYLIRVRRKVKKEILEYKESEKKLVLERALTNEKRMGEDGQ